MNVNISAECLSNYEPHWVASKVSHESRKGSLTLHATQRSLYLDIHRKNEFHSLKIWPKKVCMYVCIIAQLILFSLIWHDMLEKKTALGGGAKIAVTSHREAILAGLETKTVCPCKARATPASPTKEKYLLPSPSFKKKTKTYIYFVTTITAYSISRVLIKENWSLKLYDMKCAVFPSFFVFVFFLPGSASDSWKGKEKKLHVPYSTQRCPK